ncbi:MAG: SDR family NAD(P)-dependent oxidoreductase [Chitinophagaceae bacterium]|nr:SDR family NAD(P)-dependent oxidoreductase [Chitinophagaceae bacterium]
MKIIVVTGASGNLGQAVVRKFLAEGYYVIGTIVPNDSVEISIKDKNFETVIADLLNEDDSSQFIFSVIERWGRIDAAVLTVGGFAMGKINETSAADIKKQYSLNFETVYNIARPVFSQMMKQKSGRIFMIGSRPGSDMHNSKGMVAYGLTKSLVFRLAELMNDEAKGTDVVTSVVVPSTIDTLPNRRSMPDADFSKWVRPEAIADVIAWYCNETSSILREPVIKVYNNS